MPQPGSEARVPSYEALTLEGADACAAATLGDFQDSGGGASFFEECQAGAQYGSCGWRMIPPLLWKDSVDGGTHVAFLKDWHLDALTDAKSEAPQEVQAEGGWAEGCRAACPRKPATCDELNDMVCEHSPQDKKWRKGAYGARVDKDGFSGCAQDCDNTKKREVFAKEVPGCRYSCIGDKRLYDYVFQGKAYVHYPEEDDEFEIMDLTEVDTSSYARM